MRKGQSTTENIRSEDSNNRKEERYKGVSIKQKKDEGINKKKREITKQEIRRKIEKMNR